MHTRDHHQTHKEIMHQIQAKGSRELQPNGIGVCTFLFVCQPVVSGFAMREKNRANPMRAKLKSVTLARKQ